MQNDARTHGLWRLSAPPPPPTAPLQGCEKADVAVIGGGYAGLSAALHLAEAGASVAVLEAAEIGFGGAGRNVGLVNAGLWVVPDTVVDRLGGDYGERLIGLLGDAPQYVFNLIRQHGIACEAEHNGTLHCAVGEDGLRDIEKRAAQWQRRCAPVTLLDAAETEKMVGSSAYRGALYDRRAGTIQPLAYVRGLAAAALRAGAQVFTGSAAIAAERENERWIVRTASGSISARWVIVATDAYASGLWSTVRDEQVHLPYFNFSTTPLPADVRATILPEMQGAWDTRKILSSFRLDHAGRLVFGSVGALRGGGASIHRAWAKRTLERLFPQIGTVVFETEWYGMIGMTVDDLPRFHKLGDNVIAFCGYNGRGIAPGTVFGAVLSSHILGSTTERHLPLPATSLESVRLRRVRETIYEAGSALAHLVG